MSAVLHLVSHDLRAHRTLLLVWTVIVVAHPLMAAASVLMPGIQQIFLPIALIASRLTLGAITIATIVQADSPLDDRTFWRTRPIAGSTMATAKLVMGGLFLMVPLGVVLLVAAVLGLPASHLPSTVAQVVVTDAAAVGLALFASARTRSVPSMIVALMAVLVGLWVLYGLATETLRVPWLRQWYADGPPSPAVATPTLLALAAIATWTLTALVFTGPARRLRQLVVTGIAVVALAIVWLSPAARLHSPEPKFQRALVLTPRPSTVRAVHLTSDRIVIFSDGEMGGALPGDRTRQYLIKGDIDTPFGPFTTGLTYLRGADGRQPTLLGILTTGDFERLAGQRVRLRGEARLEVTRTDIIGTLPLVVGAALELDDLRVRIRDVNPVVSTHLRRLAGLPGMATADVLSTWSWTGGMRVAGTHWWLRRNGERVPVFRAPVSPFGYLGMLPTLPRPFFWSRTLLSVAAPGDTTGSVIELEQTQRPYLTTQAMDVEFVVPTQATPRDGSLDDALPDEPTR